MENLGQQHCRDCGWTGGVQNVRWRLL